MFFFGKPDIFFNDFFNTGDSHVFSKRKFNLRIPDSMGPLTEEDIKQIKKKAREVIPERVEYYAKLAWFTNSTIADT